MHHNQVTLDPTDIDASLRRLTHFYPLDKQTLHAMRRILAEYPKPIILYVDVAHAMSITNSPLDDQFTFNTQTGELVLFSADDATFIDALIEMHMYTLGFETLMGHADLWAVELAIGAWKPIKNKMKARLNIPVVDEIRGTVGLPPSQDEQILEDEYPFKTLVSTLNTASFMQMVRLAGHPDIFVHFPEGTEPRVMYIYESVKRLIQRITRGLDEQDVDTFNQRLSDGVEELRQQYKPEDLPLPPNWQRFFEDKDAAGDEGSDEDDAPVQLGPPDDEPAIGQLPGQKSTENTDDERLAGGPFGAFINSLFDDDDTP